MRFPLILLLLVGLAGSAFATPEGSRLYVANANYYIGKGEWPSALIELKNAIQQDPDNARARFIAGQVEQHLGDLDAAEEYFRSAANHGYDRAETDAALAEVLVRHNKFELLLDQIAPGVRPPPLEARVLTARGYAYIALKRVAGAQRSFEDAIKLDDKDAGARAGLAQVYAALGRLPEAEALLVRATHDEPTLADAWLLLGYVHMWSGDHPGALVPFDKAIELAPTSEPAHRARALYFAEEDRPEQAAVDIDFLLTNFPNHTIGNFLRAVIKVRRGEVREAETALQNIQDINGYAPALYLLARINFTEGQYSQAEDHVNALLALKPDNAPALSLRAALLIQRGASDKAIPVLEGLIASRPDDAEVLGMLAHAYAAIGQRDKAKAAIDKLATLSTDVQGRQNIAVQQNVIGDYEDAVATLQAMQAMGPLPTEAVSLLVADLLQQNEIDKAWQTASAFNAQTKGSADAQVVLGVVAVRRQGFAAARDYFAKALEINPHLAAAAVDLAGAYRADGKIAEARAALDKAFEDNKESLSIILARADLEQSQGDTAAEILWLERARSAAPQLTGPRFRLVTLYLAAHEPAKAVAVAKELQAIAPDNANVFAVLGQALFANGEQQSALTAFQHMVVASKDSPPALLTLAKAYLATGDAANAGAALRRALNAVPGDLGIQTAVIEFAVRYGQQDAFLATAHNVARDRPNDPRLDELLGALLLGGERPEEAVAAYELAIAKGGGSRAVLGKARAQAAAGNVDASIATIREWLRRSPGDIDGQVLLAQLLAGSGACAPAIMEMEPLVAERPTDPLLKNDLAWCYQATGDPRALMTAQDAQHLAPDLALVQDTLGWIMVQQGNVDGGLKFLQQAAQQDAATPSMKYHLAVAFDRLGRRQEAQQAIDDALAKGASFSEAKDAQLLRTKLSSQ